MHEPVQGIYRKKIVWTWYDGGENINNPPYYLPNNVFICLTLGYNLFGKSTRSYDSKDIAIKDFEIAKQASKNVIPVNNNESDDGDADTPILVEDN